mmetsp:Transcript_55381/g.132000  ORF Transcript_55381/g.132000 Transcript_55381/m.132000 type:complete len:201 (-) Transcript_55381:32-634(-)
MISMAAAAQISAQKNLGIVFVWISSSPLPELQMAIALAEVSLKFSRRSERGIVRSSGTQWLQAPSCPAESLASTSPRHRGGLCRRSLPCASSSFLSCPPIWLSAVLRRESSSCSLQSLLSSVVVNRATYSRESRLWKMKSGVYDFKFASLSHASTSDPIGRPCSKYVGSFQSFRISCRIVLSTRDPHAVTTPATSSNADA